GWGTRRIGIRWEPWGARGADCSMRAGEDAIAREGKPDGGEKRGILKGIRKRRVWRCNAGRRQGENVGFSGGVHVRDADEKNHGIGGIGANGNGVRDFGGADGARLAAKPAARHQERGQAIAEFAVEPLNGAGLWSGRRHDPEKLFAKEALKRRGLLLLFTLAALITQIALERLAGELLSSQAEGDGEGQHQRTKNDREGRGHGAAREPDLLER